MSFSEKSLIGYFFEVYLEYPDELLELHNDYPLAPEKLAVLSDMLSKYCKIFSDKYEINVGDVKNLTASFGNQANYVVHYRNLQLHLSLRMKLTKIHRVLKFKQSDWMKKRIDFNTEKGMNAANDFEKVFLKSIVNSIYGKSNGKFLPKRINVRLVNNADDFLKHTGRSTYITTANNYAAIYELKPVLILNEPIYVGFTVLDLSKWKMYDFYYNFVKKNFDAELLLLTQTVSFTK